MNAPFAPCSLGAAQLSCVLAIVIAMLQLGLYWKNRTHTQYGWTFVSVAGYAVISLGYFMPVLPPGLQPYWPLLLALGIQAFAMGGCVYFLSECGVAHRGYRWGVGVWSGAFLLSYLAGLWVTGQPLHPRYLLLWNAGLMAASLSPVLPMLRLIAQHRHWAHVVFLLTYLGVGSAGFLATNSLLGSPVGGADGASFPLIASVWLLMVCVFLVSDVSHSLQAEREHAAQLRAELADQAQELERLHALERAAQASQAAAQERARIMQDMHDGLGSQLISSLAMAQAGALSSTQASELLRSCIDDLRLAIDSAQDAQDGLALALGNLRFRMQPRLKAAGITLHWKTQALSDHLPLRREHQLPVLRVIQESITNTLKHAQAKTLTLEVRSSATELTVDICDDGHGFDVQAAKLRARGKGLNSLDKRARVLGAQLSVTSSAAGTRTVLVVPLVSAQ